MSEKEHNWNHTCPNDDVLLEYGFGELSTMEHELIVEHLSNCHLCSLTVSQFKEIESGLALLRDDLQTQPLEASVPSFSQREAGGILGFMKLWVFRPAVASLAAIVLIGSLLLFGSLGFESTEVALNSDPVPDRPVISSGSPAPLQSPPSIERTEPPVATELDIDNEVRLAELGSEPDDGIMLTDILSEVE